MKSTVFPSNGAEKAFGLARSAVCALVVLTFGVVLATPVAAQEQPVGESREVFASPGGASSDAAAIEDAASAFQASDATSSVELADAASADESRPIANMGGTVPIGDGVQVHVDELGATIAGPDGFEMGIAVETDRTSYDPEVIDGVVFTDNVAPSTDLVTRATDSGVQLVAVLADENAPGSFDFSLELPDEALLTEMADGSIAVAVPSETVTFDPLESARFDAEVAAIIGDTATIDEVTDEQWAKIDAIAPVPGEQETVMETVAIIGAPWAVDANGAELETSYELDGDTITQVIAIDGDTAFPVVADPSAAFWWKAAKCVGQLGLMAIAVAKAASMVVKLVKYMSGLKKASAVAKAWRSLVGSGSTVNGFKKLASALGELLQKLATKGLSAMREHAKKSAVLAASFTVLTYAGDTIASIIGVDECVDLALGRY